MSLHMLRRRAQACFLGGVGGRSRNDTVLHDEHKTVQLLFVHVRQVLAEAPHGIPPGPFLLYGRGALGAEALQEQRQAAVGESVYRTPPEAAVGLRWRQRTRVRRLRHG